MKLTYFGVEQIPLVNPGDDVASLILDGLESMGEALAPDDVIVIAQKIISKAENRYVDLCDVEPSNEALALGKEIDKDPRKVQLILDQSKEVVRKRTGVMIVEHKLGFVHASAGIDQSNISNANGDDDDLCLLLPEDPDASARQIVEAIRERLGFHVGVVINDSLGRAWRIGQVGHSIGVAGFTALEDYIGSEDIYGHEMLVSQVAAADELAAGASLLMGPTDQMTPVVIVRGYCPRDPDDASLRGVGPLLRPKEMDMFR
ncbi:MAG: coenzyme F420-0:L-glutamate ligase/coenzyme F420-1:gamma-L-glutamate ligase [Candidatus Azotimanducaceae bacterium]|jgi:coenzyme F420-0:L-glutamate ligase/coenzyme F420-1:gamma-L-glutamate ligase